MQSWRRGLSPVLEVAVFLLVVAMLALAAVWLGQRRLIYFPSTARIAPESVGLAGVTEQVLDTPDGNRLICWWSRAASGEPTLLYFHGNGGSLAERADRIRFFRDHGIGMFIMSYRGYGGSTGSPSEAANVADAKLAHDWLLRSGVSPERLVLYGESLGSGVAVQVALKKPVAGVILDAPYTSIADLGAEVYPFLPVRLLLWDRYNTIDHIARLKAPLLVLHGERDRTVPLEMGKRVFEAAAGPKRLATFPAAGHSDHNYYGSYEVVLAWLGEHGLRTPPATRPIDR
ncbi:MAG TPA: alpha/beta hydrolase [Hyphomicrobiaceae bacterium]|nr:alpha/beta hydrolase [Hyphomicrobiaceae bacterium]